MSKEIVLKVPIKQDSYTEECSKMFDIPIGNESTTIIEDNLQLPEKWNLGVIYGSSGSGKSTILKSHFGQEKVFSWDDRPIISNLGVVSPEQATRLLAAVGLSSVPSWLRPYHCLSVGEQFRAKLARTTCLFVHQARTGQVTFFDYTDKLRAWAAEADLGAAGELEPPQVGAA
ncbi:MAG: ABC transporter ATP-binding protein [Nitrososphaera sp.]|nr:ABC transporter ATP-binding protein [Nitrososphaera sp.]